MILIFLVNTLCSKSRLTFVYYIFLAVTTRESHFFILLWIYMKQTVVLGALLTSIICLWGCTINSILSPVDSDSEEILWQSDPGETVMSPQATFVACQNEMEKKFLLILLYQLSESITIRYYKVLKIKLKMNISF